MWRALLVLLLLTGPAAARPIYDICGWDYIPDDKFVPPTVLYDVLYITKTDMKPTCGDSGSYGCAVKAGTGYWQIYVRNDIVPRMRHCVIFHERAHLPPNNWRH